TSPFLKSLSIMKTKTVIITGANGNLGTAVVKKFLESGYKVVATVIHESMLDAFEKHERLEVSAVDLANEADTSSFISTTISKYKTVDATLMLAGGFAAGDISKTASGDVLKMVTLNFETAYHVARPLFEHMKQNDSGRLIFVGARPALNANAGKNMIAYALSKSMVIKLAELLNADAKGKNVTATVVIPSTIDTPPNRKSMPDANFDDWVKAEQIADLMEMVCSDTGNPLRETVLKIYGNA
ncbi:MAG TPA: SDR family NAD(P)-dependent oxidoreductase, partial [Chitinophagales bacterium]|nr:SDR family NAD(P)-dependent oxidoreductase [Chitinophagales bacterium]